MVEPRRHRARSSLRTDYAYRRTRRRALPPGRRGARREGGARPGPAGAGHAGTAAVPGPGGRGACREGCEGWAAPPLVIELIQVKRGCGTIKFCASRYSLHSNGFK